MRLAYYAGASTAAAAACLLKAFHERPNFYSATVYLSQSNACLLILTNLCLVLACSIMYALQRTLYGPLRPIEMEQLSEKAWYAVLDTLLAMPSFREDVGGWLLFMFVLLLAGKVWGWIGEGRVDILEQGQPTPGGRHSEWWLHARLATSLLLSVVFNLGMLDYCVETVMADPRPGMMVIFTFEFAILSIFSAFTAARYALCLMTIRVEKLQLKEAVEARKSEIRAERAAARRSHIASDQPASNAPAHDAPIEVDENEVDTPGWEDKRRYLFALELFTDFVKLLIYIVFFTVSITFNGLPMHIMRDVYMTFASFSKRISDYVAYRKATSDMNTRYPDATTEEIRGDACIVCRENMIAWEQPAAVQGQGQAQPAAARTPPRRDEGLRAKKLPCGHILHLRCLKAWLERQQVCPTCRRPVVQQAAAAPGGAPGQAVAGGAVVPGQQAQNGRPQRPNRARIFNFGPLRIGFLNGPQDQIQQVLNNMRNLQAANQDGAAGANQQGPNHLGLQVPYLPGAQNGAVGSAGTAGGPRATVPTQVQMLQLEQRLIHEAHNLGIEQQQLATLRLMEAELARLRAQHLPTHQAVGTGNAAQRQVQQGIINPGWMPGLGGQFAWHPQFAPQMPQQHDILQGSAGQGLGRGDSNLPQGLILPEGWTIMPLRRADGGNGANDNGSPLFVPTATTLNSNDAIAQSPAQQPSTQQAPLSSANKTPWNAQDGWSFVGQNGESATNGNSTVPDQGSANGEPSAEEQPLEYTGKGKGKAVEIEDAPDRES
ncbi:hypothetical protein BAUCODRAFT_63040 [Baudoinia panamericana UAMH 10762]|uniref:RING-type E3 ubiquitin transferase n=1 Tax=Baudoinia panamericana (strain UAMH 10762) TaxID=717646 RepID=M2NLT2_BAUPA|nr:uncharacterized protein BAUCODRAFT_63040 [Baudoinia panamericana UAMH 10762]EMD00116.1 hypothetical protein BAUCODRAFT_63040 [Baudoinia panamericana UAMH 10762]